MWAKWARPYGPAKYYGLFRYVAVTYGVGIVRFVIGIIIIQVIYHTPFPNSHMRSYDIIKPASNDFPDFSELFSKFNLTKC